MGASASTRDLQPGFSEKVSENILKLCPTVREKYAFDVGSRLVFYDTVGIKTG